MPPMPVEVAAASVGTIRDKLDVVGTIEAAEAVTIVSEIDGAVKAIPFEEGSAIRKGGLICQLDDAQLAGELGIEQCDEKTLGLLMAAQAETSESVPT